MPDDNGRRAGNVEDPKASLNGGKREQKSPSHPGDETTPRCHLRHHLLSPAINLEVASKTVQWIPVREKACFPAKDSPECWFVQHSSEAPPDNQDIG
ncbi:hypothetical protein G7046_g4539 [Stylonectria norvegica]|nr:hypothetical protein G7046_g4539 [Stylonectria norvegica]